MNNKIKTYSNMHYDSDIADYVHHFGENAYCAQTINDYSFYLQNKDFSVNLRYFNCSNIDCMIMIHNTGTPNSYGHLDE